MIPQKGSNRTSAVRHLSLSVLSIHAWLVGSAPGCQNNLMDSQSSARQKVGKTTQSKVWFDEMKLALHHQIWLLSMLLNISLYSRPEQRPWRAIQKRTQKECFHYLGMQGFFSYQTPSSTDALRVMKWRCFAFIDQVIPTYAYFMWYYVY